MNMDPVHHTSERITVYDDRPLDVEETSSAAMSSMMISIIAVVVAVALIALIVAWSPWTGSGTRTTTPTNDNTAPAQEQRLPSQQINPNQPQVVPTISQQVNPTQPQVVPTISQQLSPR